MANKTASDLLTDISGIINGVTTSTGSLTDQQMADVFNGVTEYTCTINPNVKATPSIKFRT